MQGIAAKIEDNAENQLYDIDFRVITDFLPNHNKYVMRLDCKYNNNQHNVSFDVIAKSPIFFNVKTSKVALIKALKELLNDLEK